MFPPIRRGGAKSDGGAQALSARARGGLGAHKFTLATAASVDAEDGGSGDESPFPTLACAPYDAGRAERLTRWLPKGGFPPSYTQISPAEESVFRATMKFQSNFHEYFPKRAPQLLAPMNECGTRKMICTFIRPTIFPFDELFDMGPCAKFLAGYMRYEALENTERLPDLVVSPATTLQWQIGNCFELSILLASLLIGAGYNAYVVVGYAEQTVCENDNSHREWLDEDGELSTCGKSTMKRRPSNKDGNFGPNVAGSGGAREDGANTKPPVTDDYCCYVDSDGDDEDESDPVDAEYAALVKDRLVLRPADEADMYSQFHHQQDDDRETRSSASVAGSRAAGTNENYAHSTSPYSPLDNKTICSATPGNGMTATFNLCSTGAKGGDAEDGSSTGGDESGKVPKKHEANGSPPVRRLHSWVLVLPGGRKTVREPLFIEPSRGDLIAPANADGFYTGIEGIFNGDNYFVNLTPDTAVSSLIPDVQDGCQWEAVLFELDAEDERNISHNFCSTAASTLGGPAHLGGTPVTGGGVLSGNPSGVYSSRALGPTGSVRLRGADDGAPVYSPPSAFGGVGSAGTFGLTYLMQTARDRAVHLCCASWVEELTLNRAQYESRYPGGMKFTRYANADVYRYAAYLMPDHRVLEVYLPDTQYPNQVQVHLLFEHRADKLRRRSVYPTASSSMRRVNSLSDVKSVAAAADAEYSPSLSGAEGGAKESCDADDDYQAGLTTRAGGRGRGVTASTSDDDVREPNTGRQRSFVRQRSSMGLGLRGRSASLTNNSNIPLVDIIVQAGTFRMMQEWFERGRMLQTSVGGLRLLTYEPGVQRTMVFYWDARNDGLWRRQELFYESRALRKVKEFYRGRDDRLWYRSATFGNAAALNMGYNVSRTSSQHIGSTPTAKGNLRGADEMQHAEPIRMSEKYQRNEDIPADDDVAKYVFVRPAAVAATRLALGVVAPPETVGSPGLSPLGAVATTNVAGSLSEGGEMWVYFHYRPGSIIRPYRMYPKTDPGEECLLSAVAAKKGSISSTLPCIIVMMPNATMPTEIEQSNERNRLRWWVTMCQGRVRAMMAECNAIVESTREPTGPVTTLADAEAVRRPSVDAGGEAGAQPSRGPGGIAGEPGPSCLLPGLRAAKRVALANERQRRVSAVVSVFDTLRNRPRETEAERQRRLAEEALREEARCDYLAPYIAKLDLPATFNGDYLSVSLTMDQARRVRDEALRELKERLIHRGRIIQRQMDEEKEELSRRQTSYQINVESAAAGIESTMKSTAIESCSTHGAIGGTEQKDMSDSMSAGVPASSALGDTTTGAVPTLGASSTTTANAFASTNAAVAVTTSGEVARDAKEFAQYCKEATWRMKTLDELLVKHIDRASERYAKLAQKLADDPRLAALYKGHSSPHADKHTGQS